MRKGFTLVELLAVMVVLAVLALIATPVVLEIIEGVKESAMLRSAEMYLGAVENSVMKQNMLTAGSFNPDSCIINSGNLNCDGIEVKVEVTGQTPEDGSTLRFENGKISEVKFMYEGKTIIQNTSGSLEFVVKFCKLESDTDSSNTITVGDKYVCEVKDGKKYNFYVLATPSNPSKEINLIMDSNICENGKNSSGSDNCTVAWQASGVAADGPITVMDYLYNATSSWSNVPNIIIDYNDTVNYQSDYTEDKSYGKITTTVNKTMITDFYGTNTLKTYENLKARLPYESEVSYSSASTEFLKLNLNYGYWTLTSHYDDRVSAWYMSSEGYTESAVSGWGINAAGVNGIRPVIRITSDNIIE